MAGVTLPMLRRQVMNRISANVADSYLTADVLDAFINEAVQQFCSESDWPWLQVLSTFQTVTFQTNYPIVGITSPNWYRIHSLIDTLTGITLELRQIQELDELNFPINNVAQPSVQYSIFDDTIVLGPAPMDARTIQIRWYQREPILIGDLDQLLMPSTANWTTGIVEYASYLALRMSREDVRAESAYTAYTRWVARTKDEKLRFHDSIRIRVREGSLL